MRSSFAASGGLILWLRVSQYALGLAIFCDRAVRTGRSAADPPPPSDLGTTSWAAWPTLAGARTALTSAQFLRANVPATIANIGLVTGAGPVVSAQFVTERFVSEALMPLELCGSLVWITAVGLYRTTPRTVAAVA